MPMEHAPTCSETFPETRKLGTIQEQDSISTDPSYKSLIIKCNSDFSYFCSDSGVVV